MRQNQLTQTAKNIAKQQAKKAAQKVTKKVLVAVGKKLVAAIGAKLAPILIVVGIVLLLALVLLSLFSPDITHSKGKTQDDEITQRLNEYQELSVLISTNVEWLIALDMTIGENKSLLDFNINENAYHFMGIQLEKFVPEHQECSSSTNSEGETVENCTTTPEKLLESNTFEGKSKVIDLLQSYDVSANTIKVALEEFEEKITKLNSKDSSLQYRYWTYSMPLDFTKEDANLDVDEKEYLDNILEIGYIPEMFEEYGVTMWGSTSLGGGAYCSPSKEIDENKLSLILANAGVLKKSKDTFISVAKEQGIDPILFIAISLHETGNGTSNAVVNKNNPGGLMSSSGLYVYSSLEEGIKAMGRTLHNRIIKDGLTTIDRLGSVYAPVGATNDPNGLNQHWVKNVSSYVNSLGGLTMNCDSYSVGSPIVFSGNVSEAAQTIANSGLQWINNSRYVFGGGRNQGDISKGYFDCSSFVHWAFAQAGIDLGNLSSVSTETLNKMGKKISTSEMQVGDLIFWNTYKHDGHVGIYIGNGKFIGAQSSTGVAIESLNSSYWSSVFSGHVRRILE